MTVETAGYKTVTRKTITVRLRTSFKIASNASIISTTRPGGGTTDIPIDLYFEYVVLALAQDTMPASYISDFSTYNHTLTAFNDAWPNEMHPFTEGYYSYYFDGTGDSLSINGAEPGINLTTNDFTLECWVYFNAVNIQVTIINKGWNSSSAYASYLIWMQNDATLRFLASSTGGSWDIANEKVIGTMTAGTWTHIAVTRSGTTFRAFVNGVINDSFTFTSSASLANIAAQTLFIGDRTNGDTSLNGYISNLRVVKGTALYTAPFTPSKTPLLKTSNTTVLTAQSERFIDNSPNGFDLTRNGDVKVTQFNPFNIKPTEVKQPNTYSYYFDGSGDYLSGPTNYPLITTGPFTIELWVYVTSNASNRLLVGNARWNIGQNGGFRVYLLTAGTVELSSSSGTYNTFPSRLTSTTTVTPNTWTHIAFVRNSSDVISCYINGVNAATPVTYASNLSLSSDGNIGEFLVGAGIYDGNATDYLNGYISSLRIVNGTAVYNGNFTVPTQPLVEWGVASANVNALVSANTRLITCKSNTLKDDGPNNFTLTVNGNTRPVFNSPFLTTDTIPITGNEGSIQLDGTGDYITIPYHPSFNIPASTPFTFECWVYTTSTAFFVVANRNWSFGSSGPTYAFQLNDGTKPGWSIAGTGSATYVMMTEGIAGKLGQWNHYAWTRDSSNVCRMFTNGVEALSSTRTDSQAMTSTSGSMYIGVSSNLASPYANGQISNLRFVVGSCLYTKSFVPPNTQLPLVANTVLMTAMTAQPTNNLQFIDESGLTNILGENGSVRKGSFSPYSGNWSVAFDGSVDYLSIPSNATFGFGTGDFTVEYWVYSTSWATAPTVVELRPNSGVLEFSDNYTTGGAPGVYYNSTQQLTSSITIPINTWAHVAFTRSGTTMKIWVNGVQGATGTKSDNLQSTGTPKIGNNWPNANPFKGYISNLRIVKGTAIYNAAFTPSIKPLEPVANTVLLICNTNNMFKDSSPYDNLSLTVNANTRVAAFSPFQNYDYEPKSYSVSFNGSGYSQIPGPSSANVHPAFGLSTGDFTVESWVWHRNDSFYLWDFRNSTDGSGQSRYELGVTPTSLTLSQGISPAGDRIAPTGLNIAANAWNHIAVVRAGGNTRIYLNGTNVGATYTTVDNLGFSSTLTVGTLGDSPGYAAWELNGYVSNFRVSKSAVYTGNFTVPTEPLRLTQDASTNINALVAVVENGGSVTFDGTTDYLTSPASAYNQLTGDFTIELWVFPTSLSGQQGLVAIGTTGSQGISILFENTRKVSFWVTGNTGAVSSANDTVAVNQWYHIALVRSGSTNTLYVNGANVASSITTPTWPATPSISVGRTYVDNTGYSANGYISNFRVVKGTALYTGNFTPPKVPLTAVTNTIFLTCQGDMYDRSANTYTITVSGNSTGITSYGPFGNTVQYLGYQSNAIIDVGPHNLNHQTFFANVSNVSAFNPFGYNTNITVYTPNVMGSSFYSPSTSDYLFVKTPADSTYQVLGTNDFTVESWLYSATNSASSGHNISRPGTLTNTWGFITYNNKLYWSYNGTNVFTEAGSIRANTWTHLAVVRSNGVSKGYVNGIEIGSAADTNNYSATPASRPIGCDGGTGGSYMSDFRVTKKALYKSNFVPPTRPVIPLPETTLLTDNRVATIDFSTMNDMATVGDAKISSVNNPYYDNYSYTFDGTGDYLTTSNPSLLGTNFTIEFFINFTTFTSGDGNYQQLFGVNNTISTTGNFIMLANYNGSSYSAGALTVFHQNANKFVAPAGTFVLGKWHHVALVRRNGTSLVMYVDGVSVGSATISSADQYGASGVGYIIGTQNDGTSRNFNGSISNLRVVNNRALYTGTFTPPTSPLLTTNDSGSNIVALTAMAENETSLYFDGTADNIATTGVSPAFAYGSGDYTIEFWFYLTAGSATLGSVYQNLFRSVDSNDYGPSIRFGNGGYNNMLQFATAEVGLGSYQRSANFSQTQAVNTWTHVAMVKNNNLVRPYINGVLQLTDGGGTPTTFTAPYYTDAYNGVLPNAANIGDRSYAYISNLRVVKGQAIYTGNSFVVPTSPLGITQSASTNTAAIVNTVPDTGRSIYFDGSGDYLSVPTSINYALPGNFTVEAWVYPYSKASQGTIIDFRGATGTVGFLLSTTSTNGYPFITASSTILTSSVGVTTYAWNHIAVVRIGTTLVVYVNGVNCGSVTDSTSWAAPNTTGRIGANKDAGNGFNGLISNFRIVKGQGLYTGNFTVPTQPLALTQNASTNVSVLVNTIPTNGSSVYFDGTGDYLSVPTNSAFAFGTGDFTCESWVYISTAPGSSYALWGDIRWSSGYSSGWYAFINPNLTITSRISGTSGSWVEVTSTATVNLNAWNHIAVSRESSTFRSFINGVLSGSQGSATYNYTNAETFKVGIAFVDGLVSPLTGYISNLRVVKGTAVYTTSFTPPTAPLTAVANTSLLACQSTTIVDTRNNPSTITVSGDAKVALSESPFGYSNVELLTAQSSTIVDNSRNIAPITVVGATKVISTESPFGYSNVSLLLGQNYNIAENSLNRQTIDVAGNVSVSKTFSPFNSNLTVLLTGKDRQFKDSSDFGYAITRVGNVAVTTTQPFIASNKTELGSLYFDGTGDYLISEPNSDTFVFGTADFTVECWAYIDDGIAANTKVICGTNLTTGGHIYGISSTNKLYVANSASAYTSTGTTLTNRQWHHIAYTRSSGTLRMFLDGALDFSTTAATSITEIGFGVGGRKSGDYVFNGYIDDLRVTKGVARYTAAFTPPIRTWVLK